MTFCVGFLRAAPLLLASLALSGCLPSAPKDEEKEPYFLAGKSHVNALDWKGAVESFEKALEVNPKSAAAHFELGLLYEQKESDPAAAIFHYERYLKLAPNTGKDEMIKPRIVTCKQQLAQTVSLGLVTEKQQRDLEQVVQERDKLREEVAQWRAYAARLQSQTNQPGAGSSPTRGGQAPVTGQSGTPPPTTSNTPNVVRSGTTPVANPRTHVVKAGETPSMIARKYGVKLEALMAANPRVDARRLRVGQTLAVPGP
jgi:LysM repeat protein